MLDEKSIDLKLENLKEEILQASAHNMRVILESSVDKKLNLILEALEMQQEQMKQLAAKSRVEEIEDEMQLLKSVIRSQSQRIDALEKRLA